MEAIKLLSDNIQNIGTFALHNNLDLYGTGLEHGYCVNWWYKEEERKIEITLFTPLPDCDLNYGKTQELLAERFAKSDKVKVIIRINNNRIDVYLK